MVVYNEKGGCLLCSTSTNNTTDMIRNVVDYREFHIHEEFICKAIILRAIMLTHILDDSFTCEVIRLVAPYEGRVNCMEYIIEYM